MKDDIEDKGDVKKLNESNDIAGAKFLDTNNSRLGKNFSEN